MYKVLLLFIFNIFIFQAFTQNDTLIDLPPLEKIIEYSKKNSPMVKFYQKQVDFQGYEVKSARSNWMRYISFASSYSYGNYDDIRSVDNLLTLGTREETRYSLGAAFRISLFDFLGRDRLLKKQKIAYDQALIQKTQFERELSGMVAEQYYNLKRLSIQFSTRVEVIQILELQKQVAERDYSSGNMNINEYSDFIDSYSRSLAEFEQVKADLSLSYFLLEQLVGAPINVIE